MRGRVGRSNRKAFCYLLAPPLANLTADARRRLEALETFSELGSGFSIAMQDLDIRGAGNLLGAEQSGFMEDLGYETYQKILTQAVTELKNDEFQDLYAEQIAQGEAISGDDFVDDCAVESDLEMYFPDNYVPGSSERMLLYRELDNIERDEELEAYRQRLIDRFGPVPRQGEELMLVVPLRRVGRRLGCEKDYPSTRQDADAVCLQHTECFLPKRSLRTRHQLHRLPPSPLQPKKKKTGSDRWSSRKWLR